jgi:ABC-type nitrate/sulfonate/bicarbonate transport system substrate-binding protein
MRTLTIKVFPGAMNLALWTAADRGFLEARGLAVDIRYTGGSVEQLTEFIAGAHDLLLTSIDNTIAYKEGQGEVPVSGGDTDLVAVMGCDDAYLRFVVQPDIKSFADLRGRQLSVDAMTTGFAFVLRRMLAANGLREDEVEWVAAGGVLQRFQALMAGTHTGTLLVTPFEFLGESKGLHVLARTADVLDHYQGVVCAARRRWAEANGEDLANFIAGYVEAVNWLHRPENRGAAADILCAHLPQMPRAIAERSAAVYLADEGGIVRDGGFDMKGIEAILELRAEYGPAPEHLHAPESYIDTRWLAMAQAKLQA